MSGKTFGISLLSCGLCFAVLYLLAGLLQLTWMIDYFVAHIVAIAVYWIVYFTLEKKAKASEVKGQQL